MKRSILSLCLLALLGTAQAQSLDECQRAAESHYPLIRRSGLITQTAELTVRNIEKGWLPQITASAQATYQSDVTAWPERMQETLQRMGLQMKGLTKDQYKLSLDLQQTLYDGGAIGSQSALARQEGRVQEVQNEVNLYQVRKRVNELYFSLLLIDEQIQLNDDIRALLLSTEQRLTSMVEGGTAATSDFEQMKAERLSADGAGEKLRSQRSILQQVLSALCGIEVSKPVRPELTTTTSTGVRPELRLFDQEMKLTDIRRKALDTQLRPKLLLFAQGYYGYPGLNLFEDMMKRQWSINGIVGVRLSWQLGALYTRKHDKAKLRLQHDLIENAREVFLFNSQLEEIQQKEQISQYRRQLQRDDEIIALRTNVRRAAESKLAHGIIDIDGLVREVNKEHAAKIQRAVHEIEMLREVYQLKYTNNH